MPKPRKRLISLSDTPYYHCISRCVRRAFLCGEDRHSGYNFEHRRQWIVDRMLLLSEVFTIDVCAYAVMSNHYHVVLHADEVRAKTLSDDEVAKRWLRIFAGPPWARRWMEEAFLDEAEKRQLEAWLETLRPRLCDISWFMRCLNEPIARMANAEDGCTGRFWEGRFKSQALLDEAALLQCMTYVDLNPIRAGMAPTPERSYYTAIQRRISQAKDHGLMRFADESDGTATIPFPYLDYLELVDWSGRMAAAGKPGAIPGHAPPLLSRLGVEPSRFADFVMIKSKTFASAVGPVEPLRKFAQSLGLKFIRSGTSNLTLHTLGA